MLKLRTCRINFTPITQTRTQKEATKQVAAMAATQQQSAQATLIKLHQKIQSRLPVGRQNPFLVGVHGQEGAAHASDSVAKGDVPTFRVLVVCVGVLVGVPIGRRVHPATCPRAPRRGM
jgi:hypothetical protein